MSPVHHIYHTTDWSRRQVQYGKDKVSSGTSRGQKLGTQIGRTLHIDLAERMGDRKEARESSLCQETPAFNGYSLALSR